MTKWKEQIDTELGLEPKFHDGLQRQIAERATQLEPIKRMPKPYVATVVGACFVALLLILTLQPGQPTQQASTVPLLHDMVETDGIDAFYVSNFYSERDQFLARANSAYIGVKKYSSMENIQMMSTILREAQLAEEIDNDFSEKDAVVKLESGEMVKLKLFDHGTWLGILDVQTQLYYTAEGVAVEDFNINVMDKLLYSVAPGLCALTASLVQSFLPKLLGIKKRVKRKRTYFEHAVRIGSLILTLTLFLLSVSTNFLVSGYVIAGILFLYFVFETYRSVQMDEDRREQRLLMIYTVFFPVWAIVTFSVM